LVFQGFALGEERSRRFFASHNSRIVKQAARRIHVDGLPCCHQDYDIVRRRFCSLAWRGAQITFELREAALQLADEVVRRKVQAFLQALSFERAILFQQSPAEPGQCGAEDEHNA
jgi:hypothetical protein